MLRSLGFALLPGLLFTLNCVADEKQTEKRESCTTSIDQPKQGENVGPDGNVSGRANTAPGTFAWILARKQNINGWWPQSNGALEIKPDGTYSAYVTYGKDGDKGPFEVSAVIVDSAVNEALNRWVDRANSTGQYPPLRFPNVHDGCTITKVVVNKQ